MVLLSIGKQSDIEEILVISDACFGTNYLTYKQIEKNIKSSRIITIKANHSLLGFCIFFTPKNSQALCSIETIAITPKNHQKGYGTKLLNQTLAIIQNSGFKTVNYKAWTEGPNGFFLSKIEKLGFVKLQVIENYWMQASFDQPFNCRKCGKPPCKCSLAIYQKEF